MPIYEIELYELHTQMYRVKATSEAQAIKKLFDGGAHAVDDGLECATPSGCLSMSSRTW